MEEVLALLLSDVFACTRLDVGLNLHQLACGVKMMSQEHCTFLEVGLFEKSLLNVGVKWGIDANEVDEEEWVLNVFDCELDFLRFLLTKRCEHTSEDFLHCDNHSSHLLVAIDRNHLFDFAHAGTKVRLGLNDFVKVYKFLNLKDDVGRTIRHFEDFKDSGSRSDFE